MLFRSIGTVAVSLLLIVLSFILFSVGASSKYPGFSAKDSRKYCKDNHMFATRVESSENTIQCGWRTSTAVISYLCMIAAVILLIACVALEFFNMPILRIVSVVCTVLALVLMLIATFLCIADVSVGDQAGKSQARYNNVYKNRNALFVFVAIFEVFADFLMIGSLVAKHFSAGDSEYN